MTQEHELRVESSCRHGGGNLALICGWLLDCLDRRPPKPGEAVVLYLCHHPDDWGYFNQPADKLELTKSLIDAYERERGLDVSVYGPLRFHLKAPSGGDCSLRLYPGTQEPESEDDPHASLGFVLHETGAQTSPGVLNLVRRSFKPLGRASLLCATLTIESGATLAPHVEAWQGQLRWTRPILYLPEGRCELFIGPSAGCDIYAPALAVPVRVYYDSGTGGWEWFTPLCPQWQACGAGHEFEFRQPGRNDAAPLALSGRRLPQPLRWYEVEAENRRLLPLHDIELRSCVLPRPQPDGYGALPPRSPAELSANSNSALRLPGGEWLYLNSRTGEAHLYSPRRAFDWKLEPGRYVRLDTSADEDLPLGGRWREDGGVEGLASHFLGEFRFEPPLVQPLASGALLGCLPDDVFPQHSDSALTPGRPPVKLKSPDGHSFALVINRSARLPVFVIEPSSARLFCYEPAPEKEIALKPDSEFIVGTTRYCLRSAEDQVKTDQPSRG